MLVLAGVFLIPSVQSYAAQKGTTWFNSRYDQALEVKGLQYHFPNELSLAEVYLPDHKGDTLVYISKVDLGFKAWDGLSRSLYLNKLEAEKVYFYMRTQEGDTLSNLRFLIEALKSDQERDPNRSFNLSVSKLRLEDSRYYFENRNYPEKIRFFWAEASTDMDNFLLAGRDVSAKINALQFRENEDFIVQNAAAEFLYGPKGLVVKDLDLTTGRGHLAGDLTFMMASAHYYSRFVDSVYMIGQIDYGQVAAEDIRYFSEAYPKFPTTSISGEFEGTVNDLYLRNMELGAWDQLSASGNLHLEKTTLGTGLEIHTDNLKIRAKAQEALDLIGLFRDSLPENLILKAGLMEWQGSYHGGLYDFATKSAFFTDLGDLEMDLNIQNLRSLESIQYQGQVAASDLNLADLLENNKDFNQASLDLNLNGTGLNPVTMRSGIRGEVFHFDYRGYRYRGMTVNGAIEDGNFEGEFKVRDANLKLDFDGFASFNADTAKYDFKANVDSANLYALHLVEDSLAQYQGSLDIDFLYLDQDHWEGKIDLFDVNYRNSKSAYDFKDVAVVAAGLDTNKALQIRSDILDMNLYGSFRYQELSNLITSKFSRYVTPERYRDSIFENLSFDFDLQVKEASALSQSLLPQLLLEPGTKVQAYFHPQEKLLNIDLNSAGIRYGSHLFKNLEFNLLSGQADLVNLTLDSYEIGDNGLVIDSVQFVNVFSGDSMNNRLDFILRDSIDSYSSFEGLLAIVDTQAFRMQWDRGNFNLGNRNFILDSSTVMRLDSNGFSIDWLEITGPSLQLNATGYVGNNPNRIMRVNVQGMDLDYLNYFQSSNKSQWQGMLQGSIIATELSSNPKFLANLHVDSLSLNQVALGKLDISSDYSYDNGKIFLDASLKKKNLETLKVDGFYDSEAKGIIDLSFNFNRFNLAALDPFAAPVAENLRGLATGTFTMKGLASKPKVDGEFILPKAGLTISFLQTDYNLVGTPKVLLDNESIRFPNLKLRDSRGEGYLNGEVRHRGFRDFYIDLQIDANKMLVLNTGPDREDAYYGTAYASGSLKLQGPPSAVNVYAAVKSEKDTEFNIPIGGATEVKQSGYVNFVAPQTNAQNLQIVGTNFNIDEGVSLNFDMDITQDALVSIILNESTGNQLDGRGNGLINMKLRPNQDLELSGVYTIDEGIYRFNLEGLFAKNFEVERGGTVSWNGDPYTARLDLTAIYRTKANPGLLTGESASSATPVDIYLSIQGELTNPQISFNIDLPRAASSTQAIIANRLNTDQAINQQVFSLLAFGSFTPPSDLLESSGDAINEWDFIAGQAAAFINRFTSNYDYEVSLSYQPANQGQEAGAGTNSQEELEVGVSKNFFEDRLTVNSSVEVPLNENNNSIAGDFEFIYKLTEDGRVRAKAFNRSVDNNFNLNIGQQQLYQQGLGLSFKLDFETYGELWRRALAGAKREEEPAVEVPSDQ